MAQAVALAERHGTFQHDKHAGTRLAGSEETGTALVAPNGTELADAPDLRPRQHRKHLMATGSDDASIHRQSKMSSTIDTVTLNRDVMILLGGRSRKKSLMQK